MGTTSNCLFTSPNTPPPQEISTISVLASYFNAGLPAAIVNGLKSTPSSASSAAPTAAICKLAITIIRQLYQDSPPAKSNETAPPSLGTSSSAPQSTPAAPSEFLPLPPSTIRSNSNDNQAISLQVSASMRLHGCVCPPLTHLCSSRT